MKRLFTVLLVLCLLLSLCACGNSIPAEEKPSTGSSTTAPSEAVQTEPEQEPSSITPILYQLTDSAGNRAWLFGSIHVGQEDYYPLPDYISDAYENSDALAVECDIVAFTSNLRVQTNAMQQLLYLDGTKISDHIPEELYTKAVEVLKEYGVYLSALDMYCPSLWSSLIESAMLEEYDVDSKLGLDMYFLKNAHKVDKEIQEVESAEFQYAMLAGFSEEVQIELLEGTLYSYDHKNEAEAALTKLTEAWMNGDEEALVELINEEAEFETEEDALLYAEYNDVMFTQRNIAMADFAEAALISGKEVFICVGTAHVVGPGAMVDLLTQRGYTLERIVP